ncbi:MAG: DeoR/GlpR transcriptional regulator [Lachnospiraceae bacterium]|jgi:DeoR/GlpR family transcriptional regulator of sugar metabolism|nr:DeoR/GlpR transcriptional regulator [Lachnospiraceae bacterium]
MLAAERRDSIRETLETDGRVLVADLSRRFSVSEETIRRDLERLEEEGFARRFYGGASYLGERELPFDIRKRANVAGKQRIGRLLAGLIPDGASLIMDESSTAVFAAQALREKKDLTIVTNSLELTVSLADKTDWHLFLTGGLLRGESLSMTGTRTEQFLEDLHADYVVLSCSGLDRNWGFADSREEDVRFKRAMLRSADKAILAADRSKFDRRPLVRIGEWKELFAVVTDFEPDEEWKKTLREAGVILICDTVPAAEAGDGRK